MLTCAGESAAALLTNVVAKNAHLEDLLGSLRSEKGELEEMVQVLEEVEEHQVDVCWHMLTYADVC